MTLHLKLLPRSVLKGKVGTRFPATLFASPPLTLTQNGLSYTFGINLTGLTASLDPFTATTPGIVPASGGGAVNFLRADGSWSPVASAVFTPTTPGIVPASGGGTDNFLRADGQWVQAGLLTNVRLAKTALYTVANADKGKTIALGGAAFYALTFNAASGYDANFAVTVVNEDSARAKTIVLTGGPTFKLYPLQAVIVFNENNVWRTLGRGRYQSGASLFVDVTNGNDANDGLVAGAGGAFATMLKAWNTLCSDFDTGGAASTISVADGTYTGTQLSNVTNAWTGGGAVAVTGNVANPGNVLVNGGFIWNTPLPGPLTVRGFRVVLTGTTTTLGLAAPGILNTQNMILEVNNAGSFGSCLSSSSGGQVTASGPMTFRGTGPQLGVFSGNSAALVMAGTFIIDLSGGPFTTTFMADSTRLGNLSGPGAWQDQNGHTRQTATGNTHSNTTLDTLSINTNTLSVNMFVVGSGIPAGTTIAAILSASSVQLSAAATSTLVGTAIKFELAAGAKFNIDSGSIIYSGGLGPDFYPGTTPGNGGTAPGGGFYI